MNKFKIDAVYSLYPEAKRSNDEGFYDNNGNKIVIDEELVSQKETELKTADDVHQYQRNREQEYPDWTTQLDYMYHNGFEKWKTDMIDPIKDKYPKG
jgi:hypothetical protein